MSTERSALFVGVDSYDSETLENLPTGASDARSMARILSRHFDGEINYQTTIFSDRTDSKKDITRPELIQAVKNLFSRDGEILFYFSGHGMLTETGAYLCTKDASQDNWGVSMEEIQRLANKSKASEIIIILDCCHSGDFGNFMSSERFGSIAMLRENITIMAAARDNESAKTRDEHSDFTSALLTGLEREAADSLGWVTAPSLYAFARARFSISSEQRPVFKSHTSRVSILRKCEPIVARQHLLEMVELFPAVDKHSHRLDPKYEPEDSNGQKHAEQDPIKLQRGRLFKQLRDAGLVIAEDKEDFFWAAQKSKRLYLTARGQEYILLVNNGII